MSNITAHRVLTNEAASMRIVTRADRGSGHYSFMLFTFICVSFLCVVSILFLSIMRLYRMHTPSETWAGSDDDTGSVHHRDTEERTGKASSGAPPRGHTAMDEDDASNPRSYPRNWFPLDYADADHNEAARLLLARRSVGGAVRPAVPVSRANVVSCPCVHEQSAQRTKGCDGMVCGSGVITTSGSNSITDTRSTMHTGCSSIKSLHDVVGKIISDSAVASESTVAMNESPGRANLCEVSPPAQTHQDSGGDDVHAVDVLGEAGYHAIVDKAAAVPVAPVTDIPAHSSPVPSIQAAGQVAANTTENSVSHGVTCVLYGSVIASPGKNYLCDDLIFEDDVNYCEPAGGAGVQWVFLWSAVLHTVQ